MAPHPPERALHLPRRRTSHRPGYHRGGAGVEVTKFSGVWAYNPEQEMYEATAGRLVEELRINNSGAGETVHHKAKQIEATHGVPVRNGDVLVPGYDVEGKLWTVHSQSIEWAPAV
jgi:hypothetical protein